jgi:hypothetical protein
VLAQYFTWGIEVDSRLVEDSLVEGMMEALVDNEIAGLAEQLEYG